MPKNRKTRRKSHNLRRNVGSLERGGGGSSEIRLARNPAEDGDSRVEEPATTKQHDDVHKHNDDMVVRKRHVAEDNPRELDSIERNGSTRVSRKKIRTDQGKHNMCGKRGFCYGRMDRSRTD